MLQQVRQGTLFGAKGSISEVMENLEGDDLVPGCLSSVLRPQGTVLLLAEPELL